LQECPVAFLKFPRFLRRREAGTRDADENIREKTVSVLSRQLLHFACTPSEINGINLDELEKLSLDLDELGFEFCEDRRTRWEGNTADAGFHRMFINRAESCFASVSGTTGGFQRRENFAVQFDAPLKEGGGWLNGLNRKLTPTRVYIRCPKCALLLRPNSEAKVLFERFASLRRTISSEFGIGPSSDLTLEMLDRVMAEHLTERIAAIRSRSYSHEAREATRYAGDTEWIWLGEYRKTGSPR